MMSRGDLLLDNMKTSLHLRTLCVIVFYLYICVRVHVRPCPRPIVASGVTEDNIESAIGLNGHGHI